MQCRLVPSERCLAQRSKKLLGIQLGFFCSSTMNYILWMARQYRVIKNHGSRTAPLHSLSFVNHRLFVSWLKPLCVAIDSVVLAGTRCRRCLLPVLPPQSACILHLALFLLLNFPLTVTPDLHLVCSCPAPCLSFVPAVPHLS